MKWNELTVKISRGGVTHRMISAQESVGVTRGGLRYGDYHVVDN